MFLSARNLVDSLLFLTFMSLHTSEIFTTISWKQVKGEKKEARMAGGGGELAASHEQKGMKLNRRACNLRSLSRG